MSNQVHQSFLPIAANLSPKLRLAMEQVGPVRIIKRNQLPLGDTLCRIVAGQQLSTKAAATIWGRVVELAGSKPVVECVAHVSNESLRACGLSQAKSKAMKAIASAISHQHLVEPELRRMPTAARVKRLTSIWGVGNWTADMTNLFYFGDPDVWPAGDLTVIKTLQRLTSHRRNPDKTSMHFAPLRSYLALYLYKIADQPNP